MTHEGLCADPAYLCFYDERRKNSMAGDASDPMEAPLSHNEKYVCRLRDMVQCSSITEAYDAVTGKKQVHTKQVGFDVGPQAKSHTSVSKQISRLDCDMCKKEIIKLGGHTPFWFCRKCKGEGLCRTELCTTCYKKMQDKAGPKYDVEEAAKIPHFKECVHARDLECFTSIQQAYPNMKIKRLQCDLCKARILNKNEEGIPFFACTLCLKRSRRFELCEACDKQFRTTSY